MKLVMNVAWIVVAALAGAAVIPAEQNARIPGNAALRYWAAFSELRDSAVTAQQAKDLNGVLDGAVPYDDSKYRDLVQKNRLALEIMSRGTSLRTCDWGLDYELGAETPVEYARNALVLGRLNVLYTFHLLKTGNVDGTIQALAAGLRFSHDVGNGGSLFATLVAKKLLAAHLRAIAEVLRSERLTAALNLRLHTAVAELGEGGLDWSSATKRDLDFLRRDYAGDPQEAAALNRIIGVYVAAVGGEAGIPAVNQALQAAPQKLVNVIPDIGGVLKAKHDLIDAIHQTRSILR